VIDEVWPYGCRIHRRTINLRAEFNDGSVTGEIIEAVLPAAVLILRARRAHRSAGRPKKTAARALNQASIRVARDRTVKSRRP
jgi:hypothetical protein